jgi:hypothetical protein
MSHVGTALRFALAVAIGATQGPKDAFPKAAPVLSDDRPADPAVVRELEADLIALAAAVSGDLAARVGAETETIANQATEQQTAALLQRHLATRSPMANHAERRAIPTFVIWAGREVPSPEAPQAPPASVP